MGARYHRCIHAVTHLIEDHAQREHLPAKFCATKLIEGDEPILKSLDLDQNEVETLEHMITQMEQERGLDRMAALADMRFQFITALCRETVVHPRESRERLRSKQIDKVLTGKYTAIPAFVGIMALVFFLTFGVIGAWLSDCLELGIDWFTGVCDQGLSAYGINPVVHSLVIDGVFAGVGSVLSLFAHYCGAVFLPVHFGGQRLYGAGGICDGQAAAENRTVRQKLCANAHWLWLLGACDYGNQNAALGPGSENDHPFDPLHELLAPSCPSMRCLRQHFSQTTAHW